jgi:hypothetical protein
MIAIAAALIAITGSHKLEKNGSVGILPFVKGNELFSSLLILSTFTVSTDVM